MPIENIKDFNGKFTPIEAFLCYISTDISEEPNFDAKYLKIFDSQSGLFKVFIKKLTSEWKEENSNWLVFIFNVHSFRFGGRSNKI